MIRDVLTKGFDICYDGKDDEVQNHYLGIIADGVRNIPLDYIKDMRGIFVPNHEYLTYTFTDFIKSSESGIYFSSGDCKFAGCIIFPIYNIMGEVCGITSFNPYNKLKSKELKESGEVSPIPLYVYKESDTDGFDKSKYIFGRKNMYERALKEGYIVLVDGVFDSISMNGNNINTGALLGSNLSNDLKAILKLIDRVYILYDNDNAGVSLFNRLKTSINAIPVTQNGFKDVDELLKSKYSENFLNEFRVYLDSKSRLPFNFSINR